MRYMKLALVGAILASGAMLGTPASASEAMDKAMAECSGTAGQTAQNKWQCEQSVLAMAKAKDAAAKGTSVSINLDFNDADDTPAQKTAKQTLYKALDDCDAAGKGGHLTDCHMQAFDAYQASMN